MVVNAAFVVANKVSDWKRGRSGGEHECCIRGDQALGPWFDAAPQGAGEDRADAMFFCNAWRGWPCSEPRADPKVCTDANAPGWAVVEPGRLKERAAQGTKTVRGDPGILEMRRGLSASRQSPSVPMIRDAAIDGKKNREGRGYEGKCGRDKFPRWRAEVSARRLCVRNGAIGALTCGAIRGPPLRIAGEKQTFHYKSGVDEYFGDLSSTCGRAHFPQGFFLDARMVRNGLRLLLDSPSARVCVKESGVSKVKISWKRRFLPFSYRSSDKTSRLFSQSALCRVRQATGAVLSHQNTLNSLSLSSRQKIPRPAISPSVPVEWYSSIREFEPGPARHISSPSPARPISDSERGTGYREGAIR